MAYIAFAQPTSYNGGAIPNPLEKPAKDAPVALQYTPEEQAYNTYLIQRLQRAKEARDRKYPEFNNKTYNQYYENNEKIANTYIEPVENETESPIATGTVEGKLNTLLAHIDNLNLTPEVLAYDRNNQMLRELGTSFTDIMAVTAEHDGGDDGGDKEKRMARQRELLKQGTVFVQENWVSKYEIKKKLNGGYDGRFKNFSGYSQKLEKVFEGCSRDLIHGLNVYLGDITAFSMNDQPYAFTVEQMHYDTAKTLLGQFENWIHVRPGAPTKTGTDTATGARTIYDTKYRVSTLSEDQVEIIKYQDPSRDEFMIMVNGIMMLPPGFPLSAVTPAGRFNIAKQTLYIINSQFAYGKAFVSSGAVYEISRVLDRMIRLFELKTRKSITPAYINTTNRVIPSRVLNPGNISMGIPAGALQPIGTESQGVTSSEFQVFQELQAQIERSTVSATFQGQQSSQGATATEIIEIQRQAKLTLGLIVSACTLLEVKLSYLRLHNIIGNWLQPIGTYEDGTARYRNVTRKVNIKGYGEGERRVIPVDGSLPSPEAIRMLSLSEEATYGFPVRRMYLSPKLVKEAEIRWYIVVEPQEQHSSAYFKLLFREMLGDAMSLFQLGIQPNTSGITDEFGKVYNVDKSKIFASDEIPVAPAGMEAMPDAARTAAGNAAAGNNRNATGVPKQPQPKPKT